MDFWHQCLQLCLLVLSRFQYTIQLAMKPLICPVLLQTELNLCEMAWSPLQVFQADVGRGPTRGAVLDKKPQCDSVLAVSGSGNRRIDAFLRANHASQSVLAVIHSLQAWCFIARFHLSPPAKKFMACKQCGTNSRSGEANRQLAQHSAYGPLSSGFH